MRYAKILLGLLFVFCANGTIAAESNRQITVNGHGSAAAVPDRFLFSLYVEEKGKVVAKLNDLVSNKNSQIVAFLLDKGVAEKHIQSMQIQLYPWYKNYDNNREQAGFVLSRKIQVTLDDLELYDSVIDGLMRLGVARIDNFQYAYSQPQALYLQSLDAALANAKQRAKQVAANMQVSLGKVLTVAEGGHYNPQPMMAQAKMMSDTPSSLPGLLNATASVAVTFTITD